MSAKELLNSEGKIASKFLGDSDKTLQFFFNQNGITIDPTPTQNLFISAPVVWPYDETDTIDVFIAREFSFVPETNAGYENIIIEFQWLQNPDDINSTVGMNINQGSVAVPQIPAIPYAGFYDTCNVSASAPRPQKGQAGNFAIRYTRGANSTAKPGQNIDFWLSMRPSNYKGLGIAKQ